MTAECMKTDNCGKDGKHWLGCPVMIAAPKPAPPADDITPEEIEAIQKRCDAATPGPWCNDMVDWKVCTPKNADRICTCHPDNDYPEYAANGRFIAHARQDIPKLLAALRRRDESAELQRIADREVARLHTEAVNARDAANANIERVASVLRLFRDNFDCDSDAHKYGTVCRSCAAGSALEEMGSK